MTNQQILEKAIRKAIDGGYDYSTEPIMRHADTPKKLAAMLLSNRYYMYYLIFNHDFAKALWGEEPAYGWGGDVIPAEPDETAEPIWQYHLQQLVIADDVFKYLEANI